MALAYIKPGVSVSEVVTPAFSPSLLDPTSVCIVGPARGYEDHTEVFVLDDNHPVTLSALYPDVNTVTVLDASNVILDPFLVSDNTANHDYDLDTSLISTTGQVSIVRSMQTNIADGEAVAVYFENSAAPGQGDAHTNFNYLNKITGVTPTSVSAATELASIRVGSQGLAPATDYIITDEGGSNPTIVWVNSAVVLGKFQTVYLDLDINGTQYNDAWIQLNNLTPVALPANANNIVVKTAVGAPTDIEAVIYSRGTTQDLDYIVSGTGLTTSIARSAGTTTMGGSADKISVRVSYRATPIEYWLPTRCLSQSDVETKFGPAFDSNGNIINPVSFASSLAFENGVNSVIVQALFTEGTPRTSPTGSSTNWEDTLKNLRGIEDLNVIVPLISSGGLVTNDGQNLIILQKVQDHLNYMISNEQQYAIAICGEDSTSGTTASQTILRSHAQALGARNPGDSVALISPAAYTFTNPVTGLTMAIGGQYAAACVAGMFGRYPVQTPLTRKRVNSLTSIKDIRTEPDKNADAAAGLLVVESKRGVIQVRHGVTVATDTAVRRELSIVRGKHWMMESLRQAVDDQIVGQIIIDANAAFSVQLVVTSVLEQMLRQGAIVRYSSVQVRRSATDVTAMEVRFSYLPAWPLNNVAISFSIDNSSGVLFNTTTTQTQGI